MKRWRIIEDDSWNKGVAPWTDAVGIEEIDEDIAVPGIVCWFTRGWDAQEAAAMTVALHNAEVDRAAGQQTNRKEG